MPDAAVIAGLAALGAALVIRLIARFGARGLVRSSSPWSFGAGAAAALIVLVVAPSDTPSKELLAGLAAGVVLAVACTVLGRGGAAAARGRAVCSYVAAAAPVAAGLRIEVTGSTEVDTAVTIVMIGATARSFARWDGHPDLAPWATAVLAFGAAACAAVHDLDPSVIVAAGLFGASAGVILGHVGTGAGPHLGDATSRAAGFVLAVVALRAASVSAFPASAIGQGFR